VNGAVIVVNCAELETNVLAVITSFAATLVLNEADAIPNEPDIDDAICTEPDSNPVGNEVKNDPVSELVTNEAV